MRVVYFGTYERTYPRNALVVSGLRRAGVEVVESHVPVWDDERHKLSPGLRTLGRALRAQLRLRRRSAEDADAIVVGYPGHLDLAAARHIAKGRPVVFNPLVSLEDTMVEDRGLVRGSSLRGRALRAVDRRAFRSADLVVADTAAHAAYFASHFDLPEDRLAVCFVGAEDAVFHPEPAATREPFSVLFVGKLIPLHGLETILAAAALAPEIPFRIVGSGQLDSLLAHTPSNVTHEPWIEYDELPQLYRSAGCALGIFGTSAKAQRVIPNKAFQAIATSTPLVTADTPAARELLMDREDALLVPPGDPEGLAGAVRRLAEDAELGTAIGAAGRATYERTSTETVLGQRWRALLERLVS